MPDDLPLADWRVLVTRPFEQAQPLAEALRVAGAVPVLYPTITLAPPPSWEPLDSAISRLSSYEWLVFTSPSAVRFVFERAPGLTSQLNAPGSPAVAAVGGETAKVLERFAVTVSVVPSDQRQEGLVTALLARAAGKRILFPQALGGRELLRDQLVKAGSVVDVVPVSQTVPLPLDVPPPPFDVATFASPSALNAFVARLTVAALRDKVVAVIGPTTRDAAIAAGLTVAVVASAPSSAALVAALCDYRRSA